jgi:hypothetical protein
LAQGSSSAADPASAGSEQVSKAGSMLGKIVFLVGCGAGGAGLAALPHYFPVRF